MAEFILIPALVMGILIGLIEVFFVHSDMGAMGMTWLTHGLHALPFTILFVFISMNIHFVFGLFNISINETPVVVIVVRAVVAIIAMVKVAGAAAITPGARGVGEKIPHTLIVGALIFAAPYLWDLALADMIGPMLPF